MALPPRIAAIATAVPPYVLEQEDVARRVKAQFSSSAVVQRLLPVFANTGIDRRYAPALIGCRMLREEGSECLPASLELIGSGQSRRL